MRLTRCLTVSLLLFAACSEPVETAAPPPAEAEKVTVRTPAPPPVETGRNNAKWDRLQSFFEGYVAGRADSMRDPFEPTLVRFVPRVAEEEMPQAAQPPTSESDVVDRPQPDHPAQRFAAEDYRLLMIRWGTSVNKAVVEDPTGRTFVIRTDQLLGKEGGRVTAITRYRVTLQIPERDTPIELSLEPEQLSTSRPTGGPSPLFDEPG